MTQTLTALFDRYEDAETTVNRLEQAGVPADDISIVANNSDGRHADNSGGRYAGDGGSAVAEDAADGAGIGATIGGVGGLLAGLGLLAIPGLGTIAAAGWLGSTLLGALGGAAVGGATGGLVGALTHAGVSEDDAHVYAEGVRRGGSLVTVRTDDGMVSTVRDILNGNSAVDVGQRRASYNQEGWTRFDPDAPEYNRRETTM